MFLFNHDHSKNEQSYDSQQDNSSHYEEYLVLNNPVHVCVCVCVFVNKAHNRCNSIAIAHYTQTITTIVSFLDHALSRGKGSGNN